MTIQSKTSLQKSAPHGPDGQASSPSQAGLKFAARFVAPGEDPYSQVRWVHRSSQIKDNYGAIVSAMASVEVPESWSQLATDIAASKYLRRAGVPASSGLNAGSAPIAAGGGAETSVRQLIHRVVHAIRRAGESRGYFASAQDAEQFEKELAHLMIQQKAAFNSPVWFNCGLFQEYGIEGSGGQFVWSDVAQAPVETRNAYENPQCSACFIQSVDDDLMSIFDLVKNEARIFKFGSGTGTNFFRIRGSMEKLSGGGTSSGLMSFLEVLDRGAGATKSGGTTRRAAKMVSLDVDHPEILDFIGWKSREEKKVAALIKAGFSSDFNGEAYRTVSGQNSNNSVRVSDAFMRAVAENGTWSTKARLDGSTVAAMPARQVWRAIAQAAWECADPGLQFDTTIQKWHTCSATAPIYGSNPCSEFMFLDDTACNLASLNLVKFLVDRDAEPRDSSEAFDIESFCHAVRVLITAQDILVDFSSYPTEKIARNSHEYRPLGLGYANLGTLIMLRGHSYDSPEALAWCRALTSLMTAQAYLNSAEIAESRGAFTGFSKNRSAMLDVITRHHDAAKSSSGSLAAQSIHEASLSRWSDALEAGRSVGYRNAQVTVLAPTGTIGLFMDCDTTGIEPDFALVKFKKLAGGGTFKMVNQSVPRALKRLGYRDQQVAEIVRYIVGTLSLEASPFINRESLRSRGASDAEIRIIEQALPSAFDLLSAFSHVPAHRDDANAWLRGMGFNEAQIQVASEEVCGRMTIEGAPHLKEEHLAVFDCANRNGAKGQRFLTPEAHLRMMAAAQPFLSGAISKTVNMPEHATVDDIEQTFWQAWQLGLKAVAIYRDGSKQSQVLSSGAKNSSNDTTSNDPERDIGRAMMTPQQRKMPPRREGLTIEARVGGQKIFLRTGEFEDGRLGEIFIDVSKEGATLRSLLNCFAISVSMGLQYGVPLEDYVEKFTFTRFEPAGMVDHPNVKTATSLIDYVFRVLGMEYLGQTDFVHIKPNSNDLRLARRSSLRLKSLAASDSPSDSPSGASGEARGEVSGEAKAHAEPVVDGMDAQLAALSSEAPLCSECGHITIRNGSCYRCWNCGNSMGCS